MALTVTALVAVEASAQAVTCWGTKTLTAHHKDGVATAELTFHPHCSDGKARWQGVIRDTLCDSRSARIGLTANQYPDGTNWWTAGGVAGNGCGTSASFGGSNRDVGDRWRLEVILIACNFWNCSDDDHFYLSHLS